VTGARESGSDRRLAVLVFALAAALYLPLIGWGAPVATGPDRTLTFATDDVLPLGPLAEMHNTFVESKPDRNYAYPWWHYFTLACAQAPYLAWLKVTGGMGSPAPVYPFGLADPVGSLRVLTLVGRAVSSLMAAGIAVSAFRYSSLLWGRHAGLVAAALTALNPWTVYFARTGNLDVPALFWSALGFVVFARILRDGLTVRRAAWLGAFAGIAMATKDQALALFLPLAAVLLLPRFGRRAGEAGRPGDAWRARLAGLGASLLAFVVCTGMPVDPMRQVTHVQRLFFAQGTLTAAHAYYEHLEPSLASALELGGRFVHALGGITGPVALAAAVAGIALLLARRPAAASGALAVPTTFVLLVLAIGIVVRRYLFPLTFFLDAFAAYALVGTAERRPRLRRVGLGVALLAIGWRAVLAADLSYAQLTDTRYAAAGWIAEHARPGDRLEYFGHGQKLPPLPAEVESRRVLGRGMEWEGERDHGPAVLEYLRSGEGPELVALVPDWTSPPGLERSRDCPPEVEEALESGTAGYRRVAAFRPRSLLPFGLERPHFDSPAVSPPVRLFARDNVARELEEGTR
jgi:hypothetical protein